MLILAPVTINVDVEKKEEGKKLRNKDNLRTKTGLFITRFLILSIFAEKTNKKLVFKI